MYSLTNDEELQLRQIALRIRKKILLLGEPPNKSPQVISNPEAGQHNYRESRDFVKLCRDLRVMMGRDQSEGGSK